MRKIICKQIALVMAIVLMAVNVMILPGDVQAAESNGNGDAGQKIVYIPYTEKEDVKAYFGNAAPTYTAEGAAYGYLFGGWFTKVNVEGVERYKPIKSDELYEASTNKDTCVKLSDATNYYAKFVPAYILSVKCQNDFETTDNSSATEMRIVAGVDSTNYARVGFELCRVTLDSDGNVSAVGNAKSYESLSQDGKKNLWEKLAVYSEKTTYDKKTPKTVLGEAGNYFMGVRLSLSNQNFANTYAIRPFWETYDGVIVYGLTKYAHIVDGINGYINIPINLKNKNKVAAGVVEFDWSVLKDAGYVYMGAECGKKFRSQKVNPSATDNIIRCLVMADVTNANQCVDVASDDIYINLRFKKGESAKPKAFDGTFYHFRIHEEDFSDMYENVFQETVADTNVNKNIITLYDVWDIQY